MSPRQYPATKGKSADKMARLPHFADGGFIGGMRAKLFGPDETVTQKYARQDAERAAKAPAPPPAPAPSPAAGLGMISNYAGMTAMQRREKEAGMKDGGAVKGPGTGTSDSVPIMASHGEYMLPADTTKALGGKKVLDKIVAATHTPTGKPAIKRGMMARADGGLIEEDRKRRIAQIPTGGTPQVVGGERIDSTEVGRNVSNALSAVPGAGPTMMAARGMAAASRFAPAGAGLVGGLARAAAPVAPLIPPVAAGLALMSATSPTATAQTAEPAVAPATPATALPSNRPVAGAPPVQTTPAEQAANPNQVTATRQPNGVMSFSGKDISGPVTYAGNSGFNPSGAGGIVSAQNQGAAQALSERYQAEAASLLQPAAEQIAPGQGMTVMANTGGFGILDKGYQERRAASMPLSSITASKQEKAAAIQALGAIDRRQEQSSALAAEAAGRGMTDATTRRGQDAQNAMANAQNTLATAKFGLDKKTSDRAGTGIELDNSAKKRLADVQGILMDPNATDAQREKATETGRALQGKYEKEQPNRFTVVPGGQEADPVSGLPVTRPARVMNNQTGQFVEQGQSKPAFTPNAGAIAMLKSNPKMAADFDAKYGQGAAARSLGQK